MALVTLPQAKRFLDFDDPEAAHRHDEELERYCRQADGVVQKVAKQTLVSDTYVDRVDALGGEVLLPRTPVVSITSWSTVGYDGTALDTAVGGGLLDAEHGRARLGSAFGPVEVTYVAGLEEVPDEAVDAALLFVSYKYRRNHGGAEGFQLAGADAVTPNPMSANALRQQLALALGPYAALPAIA